MCKTTFIKQQCKHLSKNRLHAYTLSYCSIFSSAFGSIRYAWWMMIMVTPFMLLAEAVYTIVDKNKLLMGFLGAIVSSEIITYLLTLILLSRPIIS